MPSTFSPALRLELIGNGEQAANWGNTTNTNLGTLLEQAVTGVGNITMPDANYTLVSGNGVSDEARNAVLVVTGTLSATRSLIVPTSNKFYAVRNATTGSQSILIRTSGGTGVTLANGLTQLMYCDGTNVVLASVPVNASTGGVVLNNATLNNPVINGFTGDTAIINVGSGQFYKATGGNVGIGTSSPQAKLVASNGGAAGLEFFTNYPGGGVGTYIQSFNRSGAAYVSTAYDAVDHAFLTSNAERMRISASGNVGIGTSSPTARLHVSNGQALIPEIYSGNSATTLQLYAGTAFNTGGAAIAVRGSTVGFNNNGMEFYAGSSERARLDASGNVGIGTATPSQRLDVSGNAVVSGTVTASGGFVGNLSGNATSATTAATATNVSGVVAIANGGTGATTQGAARTALGSTLVGDAVFTAANGAAARTATGSAASGAVGSSGITMNASRLLGRTTAGSGAIEEISVGAGLTLSGGSLVTSNPSGTLVNVQFFTSSTTYTRTSGATRAVVIAVGGGGGGGGITTNGGNGGTTSFGSHVTAVGGSGGIGTAINLSNPGGAGGTGGTGASISIPGQGGVSGTFSGTVGAGGSGGGNGGARGTIMTGGVAGSRGGGGSGGSTDGGCAAGRGFGGGGQGETAIDYISTGLGATETVTIGAAGTAGTGTPAGGAGGAGYVIVYEYA
jgi:hypothetical protein